MEKQLIKVDLPTEVAQIAENVSIEKRNEVQSVLNHVFNGVSKMREQLDSVAVADENDKVNMKLANTIRLGVRQVRLDAEKTFDSKRSEVQQQMLTYKTEDQLWLKAKQTMQILTKEIEEQARWKEETRVRFEAEQFELEMQKRLSQAIKFNPGITLSDVRQFSNENFSVFLKGLENEHKQKIEAERKAEEERIAKEKAEAEERERIRIENEKLRKEAEAKEKALAEERKRIEEERKKERQEAERKQQEVEAKARKEAEERQKLEAEINARKQAEEEAERKAKLEAEKLAKAPIKKQLNVWVDSFNIQGAPIMNDTTDEIQQKFSSFKKWAISQIEKI
jgi:hypothetical protein